jgi:thioredoxin reductase
LGGDYKHHPQTQTQLAKWMNKKSKQKDGRIFLVKTKENEYVYKDHLIFGYGEIGDKSKILKNRGELKKQQDIVI